MKSLSSPSVPAGSYACRSRRSPRALIPILGVVLAAFLLPLRLVGADGRTETPQRREPPTREQIDAWSAERETKRTEALALYAAGDEAGAEAKLRELGRGPQDELHAANEFARMAFEAKADNQYEVASKLARSALRLLTAERIGREKSRENRSRRLALAAALQERVLGDKLAADDLYAQAEAQDPANTAVVKARERLRREREIAVGKHAAAERDARARAELESRKN